MMTQILKRAVLSVVVPALSILGVQKASNAAINLELRPTVQSVLVGNTLSVELFAVSDSAFDQTFSGVEVIILWDTSYLSLMGDDLTGSVLAGFSPRFDASDPYGLNANLSDGNAIWIGWSTFGSNATATAAGSLLVTMNFMALAPTAPDTSITIPFTIAPNGGGPTASTIVVSGSNPGENVVGSLSGAAIHIHVPAPASFAALLGAMMLRTATQRRRRADSHHDR